MRASVRDLKFLAATAGLVIFTFIAIGQTLSPGEVSISSRSYRPQPQILRAESRVVRIGAVVRDAKGQVVNGLKREDFVIYEDGKQQAIKEFSIERRLLRGPLGRGAVAPPSTQPNSQAQEQPPRPRYVALYFDDLDTRFGDMRHVQLAAENFIHQGVGLQDKVALFTASGSGTVDFTPDATEILSAIERLKFHGRTIASSGCPRITPYDAYEIATEPEPPISSGSLVGSPTYMTIVGEAVQCNCIDETNLEADCKSQQQQIVQTESKQMWSSIRQMSQDTLNTVQAVVDYLAKRPGERVLVLASSGFLTGTLEDRVDAVVDSALGAGVVINALDAKGLYTNEPSHGQTGDVDMADVVTMHEAESFGPAMTSATAAMVDFAVGTGGRFFHNRNDLSAGYYSLAAAPETEYLLGFAPENAKLNGAFHKLKVEVNMPGKFYVQARPGYFAPTKEIQEQASQPTPEEKIDAEVRGSDERSDFSLSVSERPVTASSGGRELSVQTRVDIQKLPFEMKEDRRVDMLTFVAALFDSQGKMVTGKEAQMQFALKPESFERFSKSGISGAMSLEAPPGSYRLRVVVEEALHNEMSATSQNVQIQ